MSESGSRLRPVTLALMAAAIMLTAAFALWLVRHFTRLQDRLIAQASSAPPEIEGPTHLLAGAIMRLSAGHDQRVVERRVSSADFALRAGDSLDPALPAGPFRAEFTVGFWTGRTSQARLGAFIEGGKVLILHEGQPVLAEAAGDQPRTVLSSLITPVNLAASADQITVVFENDGRRPCALRLVWQPLAPYPSADAVSLPVP